MAALAFDTLDYARKLEAAGVPAAQAEVHARALNEALAGSVAVKGDISNLELKIENLASNLELKIENLEQKMDARFVQVDARFVQVDARFVQVDARFEQIDARFQQVDDRFTDLETRLATRIDTVESRLSALIASVKTELRLDLGGRIQTLKWMFGVLVAMNGTIIVRLFLEH